MGMTPRYAVIVGVNKAGTSSLFVSLSTHPEISPSAVKETRYFLPVRYGRPLEPTRVWDDYFADAPDLPVRLEATPSLFYGGAEVATCMRDRLDGLHAIVLLREPVARAISFFNYQKVRLRIPHDMTMAEYLALADRLGPDDFRDPDNEKYMAFRGGCYAEFLPGWLDTLGNARVRVLDFGALVADPAPVLRDLATWLDIDPDAFPAGVLSAENRTVGFRHAGLQQLALYGNDRLERVFRRHPSWERRLRAVYYRVNGKAQDSSVSAAVREELAQRYTSPNAQLATQLATAGRALPAWLTPLPRS
jgi:hypothetical protein